MLDRLSLDDRIAGGGALIAAGSTLLPWYRVEETGSRMTANGFGAGVFGYLVFLCATAMVVVLLARRDLVGSAGRLEDRRLPIGLGALALAAVVLQLLVGIDGRGPFHFASLGMLAAFAGTTAMAVGGFLVSSGTASPASRIDGR